MQVEESSLPEMLQLVSELADDSEESSEDQFRALGAEGIVLFEVVPKSFFWSLGIQELSTCWLGQHLSRKRTEQRAC